MRIDKYGRVIYNEDDICDLHLRKIDGEYHDILVDHDIPIPDILDLEYRPQLKLLVDTQLSIHEFDVKNQSQFFMPDSYKKIDIAKFVLDLCETDSEIQRVGQELLLYQKHDMFDLLRYLKYLVDIMRQHNIVWGVGRGSSVASYVLFLLGIHKVNSLYWDLDPHEFLK